MKNRNGSLLEWAALGGNKNNISSLFEMKYNSISKFQNHNRWAIDQVIMMNVLELICVDLGERKP